MLVQDFVSALGVDFFVGVPDSKLRPLCDYLMQEYGLAATRHVIGVNEGSCAAIAAGYHLATGKVAAVYMQNSGIGNMVNPAVSLLSERVYGIPVLFVIGWRGEPGLKDEPQHLYQGELTLRLLEDVGITSFVLDEHTSMEALQDALASFATLFAAGKSAAIVVRAKALTNATPMTYTNGHSLRREDAIKCILENAGDTDVFVATTGKTGREVFELREAMQQPHDHDFLTVGSMGHASSIALGIALHKPDRRVWCLDGDGALLMHGGVLATIATTAPKNLVHVVFNNGAHESVGGMPTAAGRVSLADMTRAVGYGFASKTSTMEGLATVVNNLHQQQQLAFIEILCTIGSRKDLVRPTIAPQNAKEQISRSLTRP